MDIVRAEQWRPFQIGLSVLLVATVPIAVACGSIRRAAAHDPVGFLMTLLAGGLTSGAMSAACIKWRRRDHWLAEFLWAEMVILGLATVFFGAWAMNR